MVSRSFFASSKASSLLLFNAFPLTNKVISFFSSASLIAGTNSESNASYSFWNCSYFWVTTTISLVIFYFFIRTVFLLRIVFLVFQLLLYFWRTKATERMSWLVIGTVWGFNWFEIRWSLTIFLHTRDYSDMLTLESELLILNPRSTATWPWLRVKIILTKKGNSLYFTISV